MKFCDKLKMLRKINNLTQAEFGDAIGISRGNLSGLEQGKVEPTQVFINCVALTFHVDKHWLTDDGNSDLSALTSLANMPPILMGKYNRLSPPYQKFIENQINELLLIQGDTK